MKELEKVYGAIYDAIATTKGGLAYGEIAPRFIELCDLVNAELDKGSTDLERFDIWDMGEDGEFTLSDLIIGAYWHYSDWHGGQNSDSYAALCALGSIFSPGMTSAPEPESGEQAAFDLLAELAEAAK